MRTEYFLLQNLCHPRKAHALQDPCWQCDQLLATTVHHFYMTGILLLSFTILFYLMLFDTFTWSYSYLSITSYFLCVKPFSCFCLLFLQCSLLTLFYYFTAIISLFPLGSLWSWFILIHLYNSTLQWYFSTDNGLRELEINHIGDCLDLSKLLVMPLDVKFDS